MKYNREDKTTGVYGLWENGECLYIGSTTRMYKRWMEHRTKSNNPDKYPKMGKIYHKLAKHPSSIIGMIEECDNYKEREMYYIHKIHPKYNTKKK